MLKAEVKVINVSTAAADALKGLGIHNPSLSLSFNHFTAHAIVKNNSLRTWFGKC